ncbi:MAG: twitching motility protein PilT [Proteobacteria bacterium]|nr:MAG: twitching motility protein PilT [Pseudomonadota bacterium]
MTRTHFRFYAELNDFLAPDRRHREFSADSPDTASVKHVIEALGVPHTEVELVLVNGESVSFDHQLADGDRVAVYPVFEAFDIAPLLRVRSTPLRHTRFIADAHMGGLARLLRMTGFDTLYDNGYEDGQIEALAARDHRIVLTRDRDLLKRRRITHGCYIHALKPSKQIEEVFARLDLTRSARPLTRCLDCNTPLRPLARSEAEGRVPPDVARRQAAFSTCDHCRRVFWEGSHWQHMQALIARLGIG